MTRETRIGLLVGLVFIVAFGVLLSELTGHSGPTPPPPAAAAEHVENYLHTPAIEEAPEANVGALVTDAGTLRAHGTAGGAAVVQADVLRPDNGRAPVIETISTEVKPPPAILAAGLHPDHRTAVIAGVPVGTVGSGSVPVVSGSGTAALPAGSKTYKVQAGDRLMTLAAKFYGKGQEKQYKRILEANKKTLPDEKAPLFVGMEIVIPPAETTAPAAPVVPSGTPAGGYGTPAGSGTAAATGGTVAGGTATGGTVAGTGTAAGFARGGRVSDVSVDGLRDALTGRRPAGTAGTAAGSTGNRGAGTASGATGTGGATTAGGTTGAGGATTGTVTAAGTASGASASAGKLYTTRAGDTFSKIAREQLRDGGPKAVQKLIELNRGKVTNPNRLPTGVEIQLPA